MYGRLLWLISLQGYTARPNRVGTRPGVRQQRVLSCFWRDSCCMTKYDQISSGVSHRPITEGTGEWSSRNYVFCYFFFFEFFFNLIFFFWIFVTSDERGGAMPLYGKWVCLWCYMGTPQRRGLLGWLKYLTPYYSSSLDDCRPFPIWNLNLKELSWFFWSYGSRYVNDTLCCIEKVNVWNASL